MKSKIDSMFKYHRQWLKSDGDRILNRCGDHLVRNIEEGFSAAFRIMPTSLYGLATYYGILGAVELVNGQESGWKHISTAIDFRGWELKLRAEYFFGRIGTAVSLTNEVSRVACLVCVSEKWGGMAEAILREIDGNRLAVDGAYWDSLRFEPFVLECCLIRDGKTPTNENLEYPYWDVIQKWNDEKALGRALEKVCDYHYENVYDRGGPWNPEFKHSPFDLLPCEVILVQRIRESLGLPNPQVSHKCMPFLPSGNIIGSLGEEHELIGRLSKAYDKWLNS